MTKSIVVINSGTPTPFNNTIKYLLKNGFDIIQFIPSNENKIVIKENLKIYYIKIPFNHKINIPVLRFINVQLNYMLKLIIIFTKSFFYLKHNSQDISILYGNRPLGTIICSSLSRIFKIPNVSRFYGVLHSYPYLKKSFIKKISYWQTYLAFKLPADLYVITNDGTYGDELADHFKITPEKYLFLYNGINKKIPIKKIYKKKEKIIVASLSRLHILKRVDRLINAIPKVISEFKDIEFIIVGEGKERKNLEYLAKKLGILKYINFTGKVEHKEVYRLMQNADIFCSVSDYSNVVNPVFESMAVGLPSILTNSGSTEKFIVDYENGIIIDEKDVSEKLPEKILELVRDESLRKKIGNNAKKFIMNNFQTWEERIQTEIDEMNKIIESK